MKAAPFRWTLGLAATEFGADRRTLSTRAKTSGQVPGEDGKFSTRQIVTILHGDLAGEKLRKLRADADLAELERDALTKESIPIALIDRLVVGMIKGIVATIGRSHLAQADQTEIIEEMRTLIADLDAQGYQVPACKATKI